MDTKTQTSQKVLPVILSGGAGTRLWPVSREGHPKPFMKMADNQSLIEKTYQRAMALPGVQMALTVTNKDHYFACKDEFVKASGNSGNAAYLLEPFGRNTAAAIILSAMFCADKLGEEAIMLILPSDHLIQNQIEFGRAVSVASTLAASGHLVTFGIKPTRPETGFGYIESAEAIGELGFKVKRFVEKPNHSIAEKFVADPKFSWNSGMFCFSANTLIHEVNNIAPQVLDTARACYESIKSNWDDSRNIGEIDEEKLSAFPDNSIDYLIMEKSDRVAVVPASFDWSDIGSWNSIASLTPSDASGNKVIGDVIAVDVKNSYVRSDSRVVGVVGVEGIVVVDTADALLVARHDRVQDVKQVVAQMKKGGHSAATTHNTVMRPWGSYTVIEEGNSFKMKRIEVKPSASLSLQMHHHRSEHWVVVSGMAKVTNGEKTFFLQTNQSTFIPAGVTHRLENSGVIPLVVIEVQCGEYLGEDDIVRFKDEYGRGAETVQSL